MRVFISFLFLLLSFASFSQEPADSLNVRNREDSLNTDYKIPIFTTTAGELDSEMESQDISGILQSSRDVFNSVAGFSFGPARFRIRGLSSENTIVMINGIEVNDPESGFASWSGWGGLNDVTRFMQVRTGITSNRNNFGGIGGSTFMESRASSFRKGTRFSYGASNRSYRNRLMMTHSTGLTEKGWALTVSGSKRWADEGYVEGTFFDAWSWYIGIEKVINKRHSIGLVSFGAPMKQGRQGISIQEANDLAGTNFYNPSWGYQNGEKRNARISNVHKPMGILTHYWNIGEKSKLNTSLYHSQGRNGITGLNWYDAKDPRPDYYRYLPSYYNTEEEKFSELTNLWQTDVNTRQINWDHLYFANSKNLYTVTDADGVKGNEVTGNRSKYILEELRNDQKITGVNMIFNSALNDKMFLSAGLNSSRYSDHYFRVMEDLLGGDFWLDVDQFSERDLNIENAAQNNIDIPNRLIKKGDRYGHDYHINIDKTEVFSQLEYKLRKFEFYFGANASATSFWRNGNVRNGRFPDESFGVSEKQRFQNFGLKGGAEYKITGRHYLTANSAYLTRAPFARNAYVSPRTRDKVVDGLTDEIIKAGDVNYIIRYPNFRSRISLYYSEIDNQVWTRSYYHDVFRTFVNYTMAGVSTRHTGAEIGTEYVVSPSVTVTGVYSQGKYIYNSRPVATITRDNSAELLAENRTIYFKNFRVGNMPQTAASIGAKYTSPKYWFAGCNLNWFDNIWLEPNPDRRTEEALATFTDADAGWERIIAQEKLPSSYTIDAYGGKSWRVKGGYFLNLNISVSNLLNVKDFATGGFEQLRYDVKNIDRFPPRYNYNFGRTFFAMLSVRF
jgi:hypothetical protein